MPQRIFSFDKETDENVLVHCDNVESADALYAALNAAAMEIGPHSITKEGLSVEVHRKHDGHLKHEDNFMIVHCRVQGPHAFRVVEEAVRQLDGVMEEELPISGGAW